LTAGLHATNKSFRMIALLYAFNFLLAAVLAWGLQSVLSTTLGDSMSLEKLVKDFDYTVYTDFGVKFQGRIAALTSQITILILFYSLLSVLLGGGTIASLRNVEERFSMSTFFGNCGTYFFRFLRLFFIFGIIMALLALVLVFVFGIVYSAFTGDAVSEMGPFVLGIILFFLFLFFVMVVVLMADYAKIATVVNDARSMLKTSWLAIKFVFRHFLSTVSLQLSILLFVLIGIALYLVLENQIGMATPIAILIMFVIQQASVGFKIWTRVATFAGQLELFNGFQAEAPSVSQVSEVTMPAPEPVDKPHEVIPAAPAVTAKPKRRTARRPTAKKVTTAKRRVKKSK
jgi:hypothetical protein